MRFHSDTGRSYRVFVAILLAMSLPNTSVAQTDKPWFGIKTPDARAQQSSQYRRSYAKPAFPPLSLRLAADEDPYGDISGEDIHRTLADIIDITVANRPPGEKFWGRIAGSAAELATAEYMA